MSVCYSTYLIITLVIYLLIWCCSLRIDWNLKIASLHSYRRKQVVVCDLGSVCSLCFVPIHSSSTKTKERLYFMKQEQAPDWKTIHQSASMGVWLTLRTVTPKGNTPCGWPHKTYVSTCYRQRTRMTWWPGSKWSRRTARLTVRYNKAWNYSYCTKSNSGAVFWSGIFLYGRRSIILSHSSTKSWMTTENTGEFVLMQVFT